MSVPPLTAEVFSSATPDVVAAVKEFIREFEEKPRVFQIRALFTLKKEFREGGIDVYAAKFGPVYAAALKDYVETTVPPEAEDTGEKLIRLLDHNQGLLDHNQGLKAEVTELRERYNALQAENAELLAEQKGLKEENRMIIANKQRTVSGLLQDLAHEKLKRSAVKAEPGTVPLPVRMAEQCGLCSKVIEIKIFRGDRVVRRVPVAESFQCVTCFAKMPRGGEDPIWACADCVKRQGWKKVGDGFSCCSE